ncbi:MAG: 4Fe-4S binding protein [Candidatus Hermodarchaeota archaeon]
MSYPRIERIINDQVNEIILNFYTKNQAIEFSKDLCVGCSTCVKVCPKSAIIQTHHGKVRVKTTDLLPEIPDATLCSYCGTCVYMCPFSAITLKKNGNPVALEDILIVQKKVLPKLEYKIIDCKKAALKAKVYVEGNIIVDWNLCISCMSCFEVCPTGAFFKAERQNELGKNIKVDLDASKCIKCGTCEISCSKQAITVNIEKVNYSGEYKEIFWPDLIKRLQG